MGSGQLRIERGWRPGVYYSKRGAAYLKGVKREAAEAGDYFGADRRGASRLALIKVKTMPMS